MLIARVGIPKMPRRQNYRRWTLQCLLVLVPLVVLITFILQKNNEPFKGDWHRVLSLELLDLSRQNSETQPRQSDGPCKVKMFCPDDQFGFFIQSGAANVVPPKICLQNQLVLGLALDNFGFGINVVVINGKTAEVTKSDHFDMYSGDVKPLIELLQSIEDGSVVLMASYDEPSSKLTEDARKLIAELGSSVVHALGFRDNWVFVGGKGAAVRSNFEKHIKNDNAKNKYENWPELIELYGCIPKYLE